MILHKKILASSFSALLTLSAASLITTSLSADLPQVIGSVSVAPYNTDQYTIKGTTGYSSISVPNSGVTNTIATFNTLTGSMTGFITPIGGPIGTTSGTIFYGGAVYQDRLYFIANKFPAFGLSLINTQSGLQDSFTPVLPSVQIYNLDTAGDALWARGIDGNQNFAPLILKLTGSPLQITGGYILPRNYPMSVAVSGTTGYVTSFNDNRVFYFDTNVSGQLLGSFTVGQNTVGLAISGTTGFVANSGDSTISYFNTQTQQVLGSFTCGGSPTRITLDGTTGYVSDIGQNKVIYFDTVSKQVLGSFAAGPNPEQIIFSGTSGYGFVNNHNTTTISYFNRYSPSSTGVNLSSYAGNAGKTGGLLDRSLPTWPEAILQMKALITSQPNTNTQNSYLNQASSNFKVYQFAEEKLDLLIHKELKEALYSDKKGTCGFLVAGYDNLNQSRKGLYTGYNVDSFYQLIGLTHDFNHMKGLMGLGASESYLKLYPFSGKASYPTVYGTLGLSGAHKRLSYGLKGLFGYSFIDSSRHIDFINETAKNSRGAWNTSFEALVSYRASHKVFEFKPYEALSYLYGQENGYTEHGSPSDNFTVKNETLSVLRNELGLDIVFPHDKKLKAFVDGSWVFEYYFTDNSYKAGFADTDLYATYNQTTPTRNLGRIHTGIKGDYKNFAYKLAFTGLYGRHFSENAVSVRGDYKF